MAERAHVDKVLHDSYFNAEVEFNKTQSPRKSGQEGKNDAYEPGEFLMLNTGEKLVMNQFLYL